jgi:uncharacterized protein YndB with AHSA1/START domain
MRIALLALLAATLATAARAEILDVGASGFTQRQSLAIAAPPAQVWEALGQWSAWWDGAHTFGGDASHLSIDLAPGGALDEGLTDGGGVRHLVVVNSQTWRLLRLQGALGPLQALGVAGSLTFTLKETATGTQLTETYDVGGHAPGGVGQFAAPVDGVMALQMGRLKKFVETGKAG